MRRFPLPIALAAVLAACATPEPAPSPAQPPAPPRDWVTEIRSEAARIGSAVDVSPLADPQVDDLRRAAREAEAAGDPVGADRVLERALTLVPDDPGLWQWRAELALARRAWADAERLAQRSFDLGPRVGELCLRNWLTVRAARLERGEPVNADAALAQVPNCQVKPPVRM